VSVDAVSPAPRRRWLRWLGTLLSLGLLGWMLSRQDWFEIRSLAERLPPAILAGAFAFAVISQAWSALRWWVLLRFQGIAVGYGQVFRLTVSGLFASNFLPGTIGGDVLRVAGILPRCPDGAVGIASVVLDRLVGMTAMLFVLPVSLTVFWQTIARLLVGSFAAVFSGSLRRRASEAAGRLRRIVAPWRTQPQSLAGALLAAAAGVTSYWTSVWLVARALQMEVTLLDVAAVTGITYFLSQVPISFNALGIREAAMITLYGQLGSTAEQAAALALITRLLVTLATVPGALWLPGLLAAAREVPPETAP